MKTKLNERQTHSVEWRVRTTCLAERSLEIYQHQAGERETEGVFTSSPKGLIFTSP